MDSDSLRAFDELSADAGESLWASTVTLGGTTLDAIVIRPRQASLIGDFSDDPEAVTLTVRIRKTVLATVPEKNALLTWNSARWKIRSITGHEDIHASWTLLCDPAP